MAKFQVQLADGSTYEVEVPEASAQETFDEALARERQSPSSDLLGGFGQGDRQGFTDLAKTMGAATIVEPAAGLAGAAVSAFAGADAGTQVIKGVKDRFSVPLGEEGQAAMRAGIEGIPDPVMNLMLKAGQKYNNFADMAFEAFGPAVGAAVKTAPVAAMQLMGAKGARGVLRRSNSSLAMSKGRLAKELRNVAPSTNELRAASSALYKSIDEAGAVINPAQTRILAAKANKALTSVTGAQRRRAPGIWAEVDDLANAVKTERGFPVDELNRMRNQLATIAGNKLDNQAVAAGSVRDAIDEIIDGLTPAKMSGGQGVDIAQSLRTARELHRRAKRGEAVQGAIDSAYQARSGFENGIRNEFGKLRRSKEFKFLTPSEQDLIKAVERGGFTENTLRRLGRLGFGEGSSSSILGMGVGSAAGAAAGGAVAGPAGAAAGAVIVPFVGQVSRQLAARLTGNNARFALDVIKSGRNAQKIVASYMAHTPKGKASAPELAQLLMNPQIELSGLKTAGQPLLSQARLQAMAARARIVQGLAAQVSGAAGASATTQ